jgi:hypothetical protein
MENKPIKMSAQESIAIFGESLTKSIPGLAGISARNLGGEMGGGWLRVGDLFSVGDFIR